MKTSPADFSLDPLVPKTQKKSSWTYLQLLIWAAGLVAVFKCSLSWSLTHSLAWRTGINSYLQRDVCLLCLLKSPQRLLCGKHSSTDHSHPRRDKASVCLANCTCTSQTPVLITSNWVNKNSHTSLFFTVWLFVLTPVWERTSLRAEQTKQMVVNRRTQTGCLFGVKS